MYADALAPVTAKSSAYNILLGRAHSQAIMQCIDFHGHNTCVSVWN